MTVTLPYFIYTHKPISFLVLTLSFLLFLLVYGQYKVCAYDGRYHQILQSYAEINIVQQCMLFYLVIIAMNVILMMNIPSLPRLFTTGISQNIKVHIDTIVKRIVKRPLDVDGLLFYNSIPCHSGQTSEIIFNANR